MMFTNFKTQVRTTQLYCLRHADKIESSRKVAVNVTAFTSAKMTSWHRFGDQ